MRDLNELFKIAYTNTKGEDTRKFALEIENLIENLLTTITTQTGSVDIISNELPRVGGHIKKVNYSLDEEGFRILLDYSHNSYFSKARDTFNKNNLVFLPYLKELFEEKGINISYIEDYSKEYNKNWGKEAEYFTSILEVYIPRQRENNKDVQKNIGEYK